MKISILLPVFNTAAFLEECLQSIIAQTETNWELIAIDDFSIDESFQILSGYSQKDKRIKVYKNKEKGIIPALRLAYEKSEGAFITRMDSDDIMMPQKLSILKKRLIENGKGNLAIGMVAYFSESGIKDGYKRYEDWLNELTKTGNSFSDIYKECVIPSPCWMLWREDLEKCGAFHFNVYPEDYDLCFRFYKSKLKVLASNEVLHQWRDYKTRTSRIDPKYSNNHYFDLKLPYYLDLDFNESRPLVLWGAGKKGKRLAKMLIERKVGFHWVSNNPAKWGVNIYDVILENFEKIEELKNPQIIIAVAVPVGLKRILTYLDSMQLKQQAHYFSFS